MAVAVAPLVRRYKGFIKTKKGGDKVFDQGNFSFCLGKDGVIEGWHRGIQGMKLKGKLN